MENPEQLIRKGVHHDGLKQGAVKAVLGGMAWGVVVVALLIFGRIFWDGAPVLLKPDFPFVDTSFLTEKTETPATACPPRSITSGPRRTAAMLSSMKLPIPIPAAASPARSWGPRC